MGKGLHMSDFQKEVNYIKFYGDQLIQNHIPI